MYRATAATFFSLFQNHTKCQKEEELGGAKTCVKEFLTLKIDIELYDLLSSWSTFAISTFWQQKCCKDLVKHTVNVTARGKELLSTLLLT